jgi:hypothetical protein
MTAQSEFRYRPSHVARNDESESISLTTVRLLCAGGLQALRLRGDA